VRRSLALVLAVALVVLAVAGLSAVPAEAADECAGLRVCLPVAGPWVVVPAGGVEYELSCPLSGYIVAGTDARIATADVDVTFGAELGSPVGPGVTTSRSVVFRAVRTADAATASSFRPFIGCIPTRGGGGRALTSVAASGAGIRPTRPTRSAVVTAPIRRTTQIVKVTCPGGTRLVASTHAVAFRRVVPPSAALANGVTIVRSVANDAVVGRVTASAAAIAAKAEVQVRAVCARDR
jgi:hypothetical protein